MIHVMATATIRDIRTRFPRLKALVARDGEVIVTDRGRPAFILRPYSSPPRHRLSPVDYYARLVSRQRRSLSARESRALDEADRGER